MKKIIYITLAAAALAAASCQKYPVMDGPDFPGQGITLQFASTTLATKADNEEPGVNDENLVSSLQFFVFPAEAQEVDGTTTYVVSDDTEFVLSGTYSASDTKWVESGADANKIWTYTLTQDEIRAVFPEGATPVKVFAVANYIGSDGALATIPADKKTWADIRGLEVKETFTKDGGTGYGLRWPRPKKTSGDGLFFVMTGTADVSLSDGKAVIPLERLASKVTVEFKYPENPIVEHKTNGDISWVPQPSGAEARTYLSNAICTTTLGGPLTRALNPDGGTESAPSANRDWFEYAYDYFKDLPEGQLPYYYTYPFEFQEEGDDNQPYIKLVLPWYGYKNYGTDDQILYKQMEVYYKVVLPRETLTEPNRIYEYTVNVNIIGSDKEVNIPSDYVVKDWLTREPISSNVATGRYISLDIPKDEYDMYVDEIDIAFVSSGKVTTYIDEIYQLDLAGSSPTPQYFMQNDAVVASNDLRTKKGIATGTAGDNVIKGWVTIPEGSSYLKINHAMDNNLMSGNSGNTKFDMSPYVFKVTLHLDDAGDDHFFDRTVTITQYPSMYVTSVKSSGLEGNVWVNNQTYTTNTAGTTPASSTVNNSSNQGIGSVAQQSTALNTSNNNNGYNMIIHPTVLDENLNLTLGDSRVSSGTTRATISGLTNYRATRTDINRIVSPGFLIASSYGKTSQLSSISRAEDRCASYQENGYPAGRWRVPSEGEIEFLVKLSEYGFIPSLFDGSYWAASGRAYNSSTKQFVNGSSGPVRCVYDTWFWGEEPVQENATTWLGFQD